MLKDDLESGVLFEFALGGADPLAVSEQGDAAVPGCGESRLGVEQTNGDFVLAKGLVDGEAKMAWKSLFYSASKSLFLLELVLCCIFATLT